ncbi:MAG: ATP-binding cassette domain-containing protein, partial [Planctomycetes bacterium]|nr:ATP-binding cassette domain-containing protein [Planctomycetota bacterium]
MSSEMFPDRETIPWFGARAIHFSHGEYPVLTGMDLALAPGQIHALVGMHNSGKTALCSVMAGLLTPNSGAVAAQGKLYPTLSLARARELGIGMVTDQPMVFPRLTVLENLVAARTAWWLGLFPRRNCEKMIRAWLDDNRIELPLGKRMLDLPREYWFATDVLSHLFRRPKLLILDEVMDELGLAWRRTVMPIISEQVRNGMTTLLATQKIEDALAAAEQITVMRQGKAILSGRTGGMERLNLIRLCYDQLDALDGEFASKEMFQQLMRYTRALLNDLPSAVLILDNEMQLRYCNRSGRELFATGDAGEMPTHIHNPRLRQFVADASASGDASELHGVPAGPDETDPLVDVRTQSIWENGVKVGTMVVSEDVSVREDLRRRLVLSEKLASVGLLAAGVAHEVNNPLEIIGNYINYLDDEPLGPGARKAVTKMSVEVRRIQQIVNNLVASSSRKPGPLSGVDASAVLAELVELLRVHVGRHELHCQC